MKTPIINTMRIRMIALKASFEESFYNSASKIVILSPSSFTFALIGRLVFEVLLDWSEP